MLRQKQRDRLVAALHHDRWWGHQAFWAADMRQVGTCSDCSHRVQVVLTELAEVMLDAKSNGECTCTANIEFMVPELNSLCPVHGHQKE